MVTKMLAVAASLLLASAITIVPVAAQSATPTPTASPSPTPSPTPCLDLFPCPIMNVTAGCPVETERKCTSAAPLFQIGDECFDAVEAPAADCSPVMALNRTCGIPCATPTPTGSPLATASGGPIPRTFFFPSATRPPIQTAAVARPTPPQIVIILQPPTAATAAPVAATAAPVAATAAPVAATAAPVVPTATPVVPTAAPPAAGAIIAGDGGNGGNGGAGPNGGAGGAGGDGGSVAIAAPVESLVPSLPAGPIIAGDGGNGGDGGANGGGAGGAGGAGGNVVIGGTGVGGAVVTPPPSADPAVGAIVQQIGALAVSATASRVEAENANALAISNLAQVQAATDDLFAQLALVPESQRTPELLDFGTQASSLLAEAKGFAAEAANQLAIATAAEADVKAQVAAAEQAIINFFTSGSAAVRPALAVRALTIAGLVTNRQAGLISVLQGFLAVATQRAADADEAGAAGQAAAALIPGIVALILGVLAAVTAVVEQITASPSARFFF